MRYPWNFGATENVIAFGPYRLDRAGGRLLRAGENVPLRLKTFAVLEYLATRPGRLVSKDELLDAVWPGTHVTPSVLSGCIREVRRALGDDARDAHFVETAYRRGYRFVASRGSAALPPAASGRRTAAGARVRSRELQLADLARWFARTVTRVAGQKSRTERRSRDTRKLRHGSRR